MVKSCAAYNCTSKWSRGCNVSFHNFPLHDADLIKKLTLATKRKNFKLTKHTVLCSKYFKENDFHITLPNTIKKRLKNEAVPSIFDFPLHMQQEPEKRRRIIVKKELPTQLRSDDLQCKAGPSLPSIPFQSPVEEDPSQSPKTVSQESSVQQTPNTEDITELSFQDRHLLKEKLGIKIYNRTVLGIKSSSQKMDLKRDNKNRPRELSSKLKIPKLRDVVSVKKSEVRDPRFDGFRDTLKQETNLKEYSFIEDLRKKEKDQLYSKLRKTSKDDDAKEISYLLQRMENQDREAMRIKKRQDKIKLDRYKQQEDLKQGRKVQFLKKSERKVMELIERYEELQQNGKLKKHIRKRRKAVKNGL